MSKQKWTLKEIEQNIKTNLDSTYGNQVTIAALFLKLYGFYPKIGLSGQQAEFIDSLESKLPDVLVVENKTTITDGIEYCNACDYCMDSCKC